jgi:hypothetical protein
LADRAAGGSALAGVDLSPGLDGDHKDSRIGVTLASTTSGAFIKAPALVRALLVTRSASCL